MRLAPAMMAFAAALALAACDNPTDAERGYNDGCNSGYQRAGRETHENLYARDEQRYRTSREYREAWVRGYRDCFEEQNRTPYVGPLFSD